MNKYAGFIIGFIVLVIAVFIPYDFSQPKVGKGNGRNEKIENLQAFSQFLSSLSYSNNGTSFDDKAEDVDYSLYRSVTFEKKETDKSFISKSSSVYSCTGETECRTCMTENAVYSTVKGYANVSGQDMHYNFVFDFDMYYLSTPIAGMRFREFEISYSTTNSNQSSLSQNDNISSNTSINKTASSLICIKPQYYNRWVVLTEKEDSLGISSTLGDIFNIGYAQLNTFGQLFQSLDNETLSNKKELTISGEKFKKLAMQLFIQEIDGLEGLIISLEEKDITGGAINFSTLQKENPKIEYKLDFKKKITDPAQTMDISAEISSSVVFSNINNTIIENIDLSDADGLYDVIYEMVQ